MAKKIFFLIILFLFLAKFASSAIVGNEEDDFNFARKAFEDKFYEPAKAGLEAFFKKYPASQRAEEAHLMLGQCYYYLDKLLVAISELEKVLNSPRKENLTDVAYYYLGEIYFKGKDFSTARKYFQRVIKEFPSSLYANYSRHSMALTYYEMDEFKQALTLWDELNITELSENLDRDITFYRGQCYLKLGDYEEAREIFSDYIQRFSRSGPTDEVYYYLGEANFSSGDYQEASENYAQIITRFPKSKFIELARFGLAWAYLKMERFEDAIEYFRKFIESGTKSEFMDSALLGLANSFAKLSKLESALEIYDRLIKEFSDSKYIGSVYSGKADVLYKLSRYEEAIELCQEAVKKISGQYDKNELSYTLGWAYQKAGRIDDAIVVFEDLIRYSDDDTIKASSYARLGDIYLERREFEKAQGAYDSILKEYPRSPYADYAQFQLGIVFHRIEKYEGAIMAFRSLLANFPKTKFKDEAQYYIGLSYFKMGNFTGAQEEFYKLSSASNPAYKNQANLKIGICLINAKKYEEALAIFRRLKQSGYTDKTYLAELDYYTAWANYHLGRVKEAVVALDKFIADYPNSEIAPDVMFWLGEYYYSNKDWAKASAYFSQLLVKFPEDDLRDDARYWLGWVEYRNKKPIEAIRNFEEMVNIYSGSPLVPDALYRKGIILEEMRMMREAEGIFEQICQKYPQSHFYYLALRERAALKNKQKAFDSALSLLREAEKSGLVEFNALVRFDIGLILEQNNNIEEALAEYLKIIYDKNLNNNLLIEKANMRIAGILEKQEKLSQAEEIYLQLIKSQDPGMRQFAQERLRLIRGEVSK